MKRNAFPSLLICLLLLAACVSPGASAAPTPPAFTPATVLASTFTPRAVTCADLDTAWAASDWPAALEVLDQLDAADLACGADSLNDKRYSVHINYAIALENSGDNTAAIQHYRAALAVNGRGPEALAALARLKALPDPTPSTCDSGTLAPYSPLAAPPEAFSVVEDSHLTVGGQPFFIRGVNYYPRRAPWDRFLGGGDLQEITQELDLIASVGFNTLRIFLWYDPLFTCAPENAIPNPATFAKLDAFIALARERGLRLVVTLNDLPDLFFRPLYTDWAHYNAQTAFIVNRYRNEPAVLAWDLRNEGDLDYGANADGAGQFKRETVLAWLAHVAEVVRANDNRHLLTAGWWDGAAETAEVVDILSFHHWKDASELVSRVRALKAKSGRPILLEEVGYSSWGGGSEESQAQQLGDVVGAAERSGLAGWLVWSAFDFIPSAGQAANPEYYFGLWRVDLTAKPALGVLPLAAMP